MHLGGWFDERPVERSSARSGRESKPLPEPQFGRELSGELVRLPVGLCSKLLSLLRWMRFAEQQADSLSGSAAGIY